MFLLQCSAQPLFDVDFSESEFGDAELVNNIGIIQEGQIEYIYDNAEVRLWLLSLNARVNSEDLSIVGQDPIHSNELLEHIFRRFYPKGSDYHQRHILRTSITRSLPPHRIAQVNQLANWLESELLLQDGPPLRRQQTLEISDDWRDDISIWMRDGANFRSTAIAHFALTRTAKIGTISR